MNKRFFLIILLFFLLFSLFSLDSAKPAEKWILPSIPVKAEKLNDSWNLYYSSADIDALEQYTNSFIDFLAVETYYPDLQSYIVSEILFYTMFARPYCKNYSTQIDASITSFIDFMEDQKIIEGSVYYDKLFSFLAQKTKVYINVNETPVFSFQEKEFLFPDITSTVKEDTSQKLYESYSTVEGMFQRLEKTRSAHQGASAFKLSQDAFYRVINTPSLLYIILFDPQFESLKDSFIRSCSSYLSLDEQDLRVLFSSQTEQGFSLFPKGLYTLVYASVPDEKSALNASLVYSVSDLVYEMETNSMIQGYPVDLFFTPERFETLLMINDDPFFVCCLSEEELISLCGSLVYAGAAGLYAERVNNLVSALPSKGDL